MSARLNAVRLFTTLTLLTMAAAACSEPEPVAPEASAPSFASDRGSEVLGSPLNAINPAELSEFEAGKLVFQKAFTVPEGAGPLSNAPAASCVICHASPAAGGNGPLVPGLGIVGQAFHATHWDGAACHDIGGGLVFQRFTLPFLPPSSIENSELTELQRRIDEGYAAEIGTRTAPDLFGFGLLDAVAEETIRQLAADQAANGRVSGRVHEVRVHGEIHVGKFGRKAQVPDLDEFNAEAFLNEQGLTTPVSPFDVDNVFMGDASHALSTDAVPDPEVSQQQLDDTNMFVKLLAPPRAAPGSQAGKRVFESIGCAECHTPKLKTGNHPITALSRKNFNPYTDLLLHDMVGDPNSPNDGNGADICVGDATPDEFRTEPLMGLRFVEVFMHDGSATTLEEAILEHGGEGQASADAFLGLSDKDRSKLMDFLNTL